MKTPSYIALTDMRGQTKSQVGFRTHGMVSAYAILTGLPLHLWIFLPGGTSMKRIDLASMSSCLMADNGVVVSVHMVRLMRFNSRYIKSRLQRSIPWTF